MQQPVGFPLVPQPFGGASRRAEAGAAFDWLRQGVLFFMARPLLWLAGTALTLLIVAAGLMLPLFGPVLIFLFLPSALAGLLLVCRELAHDRKPGLGTLASGFHGKSGSLLWLGLGLAAFFSCAFWCGKLLAGNADGFAALLFSGFITLLLAIPVLLAAGFAPALVFFNDMPPVEAMRSSFNAGVKNWPALLVLALLLALIAPVVIISAGIALLILIPVMSGALYAAYRDIFPET